MQLTQGASVFTADGREAGHIDRVVLNPKTKEVTHIVIHKGLLFPEDKVVPINLIASAEDHHVTLRADIGNLEHLPNFQETHYVVVNEEELARGSAVAPYLTPSLYWYPPTMEALTLPYTELPYVAETEEHIPEGTIALKEGAKVITIDDKHVGNVERVLTEPQANRATHLMISKGLLLKENKLVPVTWIESVSEDKVYLAVGSRTINELRDYRG